jgi:hypothetical protein
MVLIFEVFSLALAVVVAVVVVEPTVVMTMVPLPTASFLVPFLSREALPSLILASVPLPRLVFAMARLKSPGCRLMVCAVVMAVPQLQIAIRSHA